jgi:hypothetical protein
MAAHVERNTPVFPEATTARMEDAADELLGDGEVSFDSRKVVVRMLQSLQARDPVRPWGDTLRETLRQMVEEWGEAV